MCLETFNITYLYLSVSKNYIFRFRFMSNFLFISFYIFNISFCDPAGIRTQDSYIKSVVLYQLSYEVNCGGGRYCPYSFGFSVRCNDHICHCSINYFSVESLKVAKPLSRKIQDSNLWAAHHDCLFSRQMQSSTLPIFQICREYKNRTHICRFVVCRSIQLN